jgi:hypothetical protein
MEISEEEDTTFAEMLPVLENSDCALKEDLEADNGSEFLRKPRMRDQTISSSRLPW